MRKKVWNIFVTKHCVKRIIERAEIIDKILILKFLENIIDQGFIVDRRGRHLLIKYKEHYLVLRESNKGFLAITYTRKVVPRGFTISKINIKIPKYSIHIL